MVKKEEPKEFINGKPVLHRRKGQYPKPKKNRKPTDRQFHEQYGIYKEQAQKVKKYPWEEWTDGAWWLISRPADYTITTVAMTRYIHNYAWKRSIRVNLYQVNFDDGIMFRFYTGKQRAMDRNEHRDTAKRMSGPGFRKVPRQ
jgi:hypothetical protein